MGSQTPDDAERLAEAVREACIQAARKAYESASISGLCDEGALEVAIGAMRTVDLGAVIAAMRDRGPD